VLALELAVLDELLQLGQALLGGGVGLGVGRQDEVGGAAAQDEVGLVLLALGRAVLARQGGQVLADVARQLVDGDQAVGLVAVVGVLVGRALEAVEQDLGEQAVVLEVQRRAQAVGGQERHPAGQRGVVVGAVVAQELLVGRLAQGGLAHGAGAGRVGEAAEV